MHHYRNGTELSYLDSDLAYDFNYQETRVLSPEVTVQNVSITIGARERGWVGGWKGGCRVGSPMSHVKLEKLHCPSLFLKFPL